MDRQRAEQLLYNVLLPDEEIRRRSEAEIKSFLYKNYPDFLSLFGEITLDPQAFPQIRQMASIIVKNSLYSSNKHLQQSYEQNWLRCPVEFRRAFRDALEMNLCLPERLIRFNVSTILGSIIRIELCNGINEGYFQRLVERISDHSYAQGILEAVGTACDQILGETAYEFGSDQTVVLQIATHYLNTPHSTELTKASLRCLYNSIEAYDIILQNPKSRTEFVIRLMSFSDSSKDILEIALEAINRFVDTYFTYLPNEISMITSYMLSIFNSLEGTMFISIFEFWEIFIDYKAEKIISDSLPTICSQIFSCLTNEDPEDRTWTVHKSASSLLKEINDQMHCNILGLPVTREFISTRLHSAEASDRAIGAIALGCVCNDRNSQFLRENISVLIGELGQGCYENEALYAIARICARDIEAVAEILPDIIMKSVALIDSKGSKNAIWVINHILLTVKEKKAHQPEKASYQLEQVWQSVEYHYTAILTALVNRLHNQGSSDASVRGVLLDTISELILQCPENLKEILNSLLDHFIYRIGEFVKRLEVATPDQVLMEEDAFSSYIVLFQITLTVCRNFDPKIIRNVFLSCLETPENMAHGEVYIALSKLIPLPEECISSFVNLSLRSMQSERPFVAKSALTFMSDCVTQMEIAYVPYLNETIPALIKTISSPTGPLDLKPKVIEAFGDIALAVGVHFELYIEIATVLFSQVNTLDRANNEEYADSLNRAILRLFSCIFISLGGNRTLRKYVEHILDLTHKVAYTEGDWCSKEVIDLLADINDAFGRIVLRNTWAHAYLKEHSMKKDANSEKALQIYRLIK